MNVKKYVVKTLFSRSYLGGTDCGSRDWAQMKEFADVINDYFKSNADGR